MSNKVEIVKKKKKGSQLYYVTNHSLSIHNANSKQHVGCLKSKNK